MPESASFIEKKRVENRLWRKSGRRPGPAGTSSRLFTSGRWPRHDLAALQSPSAPRRTRREVADMERSRCHLLLGHCGRPPHLECTNCTCHSSSNGTRNIARLSRLHLAFSALPCLHALHPCPTRVRSPGAQRACGSFLSPAGTRRTSSPRQGPARAPRPRHDRHGRSLRA